MAATHAQLDLLGVLVVAFVAALGGGMIRDVLIGAAPPAAFGDWRYPLAVLAGVAWALLSGHVRRGGSGTVLLTLDAAGLALCTVAGTDKALAFGLQAYAAILLGMVTATGGGLIRDLLLTHVPSILRVDFYATAALAGAAVLVLCRKAHLPVPVASILGGVCCFLLRMLGASLHWHLPVLGSPPA